MCRLRKPVRGGAGIDRPASAGNVIVASTDCRAASSLVLDAGEVVWKHKFITLVPDK